MNYYESDVEQSAMELFEELYYETGYGPDFAPDGEARERDDYHEVVLKNRLREALSRINPQYPAEVIEEAVRKVCTLESPSLLVNNKAFHQLLTDGVDVSVRQADGSYLTKKVWLVDPVNVEQNDWLVVNQFQVKDRGAHPKRLDLVVFVNGIPFSVFELKNTADERVGIADAFEDVKAYQQSLPTLFAYNAFSVISDGTEARYGTLTADFDRYMVWRTIDGKELAPSSLSQLEVLIRGMFAKDRFLDILRHFILFQVDGEEIIKIVAAYHQVFATLKAVESTHRATEESGDRKIGVVWHTQGSGKSLSMVFYTGKLVQELNNPTVVVVTDRNDLDDQLFGTFSKSQQLLRQTPKQATSRQELRQLLSVESGGIIFTTIQKFTPGEDEDQYPVLTDRRNVVVIVDEAHRSQYGFQAEVKKKQDEAKVKFGFAKHMRDALPQASYIGFTGTPVELADRNTPAVFGDYIDIYDMTRAVEDGATVKIYYESRLAQVELPEEEKKKLDEEYQKLMQEQEVDESVKGKWSRLEVLVGAEKRLKLIAKDIVGHFEQRQQQIRGKAMIVTMSRRIAAELYKHIIALRKKWHHDDIDKGTIKVVMTSGADDPEALKKHHTTKAQRDLLAKRMKNPDDELKIVIVCDMWLTGFDVPCMHTIYIDKPMKGHNLMQAIARVNRVFQDKPGGLVVDYIGIGQALKEALKVYTPSDREMTGIDTEKAMDLVKEKYDIIRHMLYPHDYSRFLTGTAKEKARQIAATTDYVISLGEEAKKEFVKHVTIMAQAFALCVTHPDAKALSVEIGFFKAVKAAIVKLTAPSRKPKKSPDVVEAQINQLINKSVITNEVVDIYSAVGLDKPNIAELSEEFLEDVRKLEHKNLAVELLNRLLKDKVRLISRRNVVQSKKLSEMLEEAIRKYHNRLIESSAVIQELIDLAKEMNQAQRRGNDLGLSDDEVAFYDALSQYESAKDALGVDVLKQMARELARKIRQSRTVDWRVRQSARANLKRMVKRLLRKYQFPPEQNEQAVDVVIQQCEVLEEYGGFEEEKESDLSNNQLPNVEKPVDETEYSLSKEEEKPLIAEERPEIEVRVTSTSVQLSEEWLSQIHEQYQEAAKQLVLGGVPEPKIGYEFVNSAGTVEAEAEFAWPDQKVCFLTPLQADFRDKIRARGWKVWLLPEVDIEQVDYVSQWHRLVNGQ
ncbi:type I restriction enzyme, R subunit [Thermoflavimicrobium dichotomicum]|uniref:Type I restriction enzyme endonuclease subunit n=1 Tax=Thermoflavimicrobium dichotomicum TaxID=46223 RepID=A0A1I3TJC0_9BACL|nr:type I restriction endonuclease subunit R [Thermoflavimicrobium dichotomicum]SFJ71334.1 type I restriction enzyme, R subunit [Thermoflavimicrobium dichotomicum]